MTKATEAKKTKQGRRDSVLLALSWYAPAIHRGIARFAEQAGWVLDIRMLRNNHLPSAWKGNGVICNLEMDPGVDRFAEKTTVPVVNIGNLSHPRIPHVSADNREVGRMAAEYFLQRGFRYFAFYFRSGSIGERERFEAFERRVRKEGREVLRIDWLEAGLGMTERQRDARHMAWLARQVAALPKMTAVFSEFDDYALEILNACKSAEIAVPEQVAVLGVDNDLLRCEFAPVALSSIDDDQEMIGYEAASLLGRMMRGRKVPGATLVPPRGVVTRLSTDVLAVEHPLVAAVLRTIWSRYTEPINSRQVAEGVPMSYRRLHDAFVKHVGRSISDEITRKRLEHARRLLEETPKKMLEIAWLSGFTDHDRMGKVFRHVLGVTPGVYRRRFRGGAEAEE